MDHLVRTRDAAKLLGVSTSFLNQRRVKGGGPLYAKVGKIILYDPVDLKNWAKQHTRRSTSSEPTKPP